MKKARNVFLFALVLLSVISMGSVAGTYAKYTANSSFTDQARVAKWDIKLNDKKMEQSFTIDLFKTIKDSDGINAETDVKAGNIIAPGTQGEFSFNIKNDSEVNANVKMDWSGYANNDNIPIKFKGTITDANGTTSTDWLDDITSILTTPTALGMNETVSVKVEWKWDYESADNVDAGDQADTTLGKAGTATVVVAGKVIANQVD